MLKRNRSATFVAFDAFMASYHTRLYYTRLYYTHL